MTSLPEAPPSRLMGQVGYVLVGALVSAAVVFAVAMGLRRNAQQPLPPSLPSNAVPADAYAAPLATADAHAPVAVNVTADAGEAPAMIFAPSEVDAGGSAVAPVRPVVAPVGGPARPVVGPVARVDAGQLLVDSTSLQDRLEAQLRDRRVDVQACFERASEHNPTLAGQLIVSYSVGPDGRTSDVSARGLGAAPAVGECVATIVRGMTFRNPPPSPMTLVYQWTFQRTEQAPPAHPPETPPTPPAETPTPPAETPAPAANPAPAAGG